jgi:hypothetical protein
MGLKDLVNKRIGKTTKFMGEDIKINKLSVNEISAIRASASKAKDSDQDEDNLEILRNIIKSSCDEAK